MSFKNTVTPLTNLTVTQNTLFPCSEGDARNEITAGNLLAGLGIFASGLPSVFNPAAVPWVCRVRASDIAGSDGAAITSFTSTDNNARTFTGTGTLRTGGNGINGKNVLRLNGTTNYFSTPTGGASLTGSWYLAVVAKWSSLTGYQNAVSFGDNTTSERRSLGKYNTNKAALILSTGDLVGTTTLTTGTAYLLEAWFDGTTAYLALNGAVEAFGGRSLAAYLSTALTLGCNPDNGELLAGDVAEGFWLGSVPSVVTQAGLRQYLATQYGLSLKGQAAASPVGTAVVTSEGLAVGGNLVVNGLQPGYVGHGVATAPAAWTSPAVLTVRGPIAAYVTQAGGNGEHLFASDSGDNCAAVWNTVGYSAFRYLTADGREHGAVGVGQIGNAPFGGPKGALYLECSDFTDTANWGDLRIVQTKNATQKVRSRLRYDTQAHEEYDASWAEPSANGPTTGLVRLTGRPVTSVANDGTLDTNITTGSGQCGLLVVKDATNNKAAVYRLENATLTSVSADAEFSTVQGTSSKVNVYANSGQIRLENKTGGALNLTAAYYGA